MTLQQVLSPLIYHCNQQKKFHIVEACEAFILSKSSANFRILEEYCEISINEGDQVVDMLVSEAIKTLAMDITYRPLMLEWQPTSSVRHKNTLSKLQSFDLIVHSALLRRSLAKEMLDALTELRANILTIPMCPLNHLEKLDQNNIFTHSDIIIRRFCDDKFDDARQTHNITHCKRALNDLVAEFLTAEHYDQTLTIYERVQEHIKSCFAQFLQKIRTILACYFGAIEYTPLTVQSNHFFASHKALKDFSNKIDAVLELSDTVRV